MILELALVVALVGIIATPRVTYACTIDGQPTAFADGRRATLSHSTWTVDTARSFAPFAFPGRYRVDTAIHFTEGRSQLQFVLPPGSLRHALRWEFGDGAASIGWKVTHHYAHAGSYRISVQAYYPWLHRYYPFDAVHIVIGR